MITLVIGTPDSGKSALAEELVLKSGIEPRYYLATMKVIDEAGAERVEKHLKQREGKGFITIERSVDILSAAEEMEDPAHAAVLLECVSNLVGNEMHDASDRAEMCRQGPQSEEQFADAVAEDIRILGSKVRNLVIVTNEYDRDGSGYDEDTRLYVRLLDLVNVRLTGYADRVYNLERNDTD